MSLQDEWSELREWPAFHDDWLVWIIDPKTGQVYQYNTELWIEHGNSHNWKHVIDAARDLAFEHRGLELKGMCCLPWVTREEFSQFLSAHDKYSHPEEYL